MAIQASLETANLDGRVPEASSSARPKSGPQEIIEVDTLVSPIESLASSDSEASSRYLQALSLSSRNAPLQESAFPPLPMASGNNQSRSHQDAMTKNSMAALLRGKSRCNVLNKKANKKASVLAPARPEASHIPSPPTGWPTLNGASESVTGSGQNKAAAENGPSLSNYLNSTTARAALACESSSSASYPESTPENAWPALSNSSGGASTSSVSQPSMDNGSTFSAYSASIKAKPAVHGSSSSGFYSSSRKSVSTSKISHSASAPNLINSGSFDSSVTDFPPVSAAQLRKVPASGGVTNVEDIHTANKSLVERIQIALDFDQDKYSAFKEISGEYRQGLIDAETYLVFVEQFGLSHLVLELARLLPDPQKQKELIQIYNVNIAGDGEKVNGKAGVFPLNGGNRTKKGIEKSVDAGSNMSREDLADSVIATVRKLQSSFKPSEEVEVLRKDGYRAAKGKSKVVVDESLAELGTASGESIKLKGQSDLSVGGESNQNMGDGTVKNKQRKKTSKFHRVRLGDESTAAILDLKNLKSDPDPDPGVKEAASNGLNQPTEGVPVHGVWRNGGGQKLLSRTGK